MSKTRRRRRPPASSRLIRGSKRGILQEEGGRGTPKASRPSLGLGPLMSRLRRLEVLILHVFHEMELPEEQLDKLLKAVLQLKGDTPDGPQGRST